MNWLETKAELIASVEQDFEPLGYRFIKSQELFERKSDHEIRFLFLGFVAKKDVLHKMRVWAGIQNCEVEAVFHKTSGIAEKYRRNYTVVNIDMDHYLELNTRAQVEEAKREAHRFARYFAAPFLEKDYSIFDYSRMLNANPGQPCPFHGARENRCHYGLICAKLAEDPCYESAKEVYSAFLRTTNNGFYYPRFVALLADLEQSQV